MKKLTYLLLLVSISTVISGCEPESTEETPEEKHLLEISGMEVLETGGVKLEASYTGSAKLETLPTGFLISRLNTPSEQNSQNVTGKAVGTRVTGVTEADLVYNEQYFVIAYVKLNEKNILYSEAQNFVSLGSKAPQVFDINRSLLQDTITIRGRYFTEKSQYIRVSFDRALGHIVESNDTVIKSIVPANLERFDPTVTVDVYGKKAEYVDFSLLTPSIEKIEHNPASPGDTLTLFGENFDFEKSRNRITIDGKSVQILSSSRDQIKFVLPEKLTKSVLDIKLESQLQETTSQAALTMKKPVLSELPSGSIAYETIEITGSNFSKFPEENKVYFGDNLADVLEASPTKLKVRIPIGPYTDRTPEVRIELMDYSVPYENDFRLNDVWLLKSRINSGSVFRGTKHFIHDNLAYIFEEDPENTRWKVHVMDPATETWSQVFITYPRADVKYKDFSIIYNKETGRVFFYFSNEENNFFEFFPDNKSFVQRQDYPDVERGIPATFSIGQEVYIGLGRYMDWAYQDTAPLSHFWSYDIVNHVWEQKATFPLPEVRSDLSVIVIDGEAYVGNGAFNTGQTDFWKYSPARNEWIEIADFGDHVAYTAFFEYNGQVYIYYTGGIGGKKYDPVTNQWSELNAINDLYYTYFIQADGNYALRFDNTVYLGLTQYPFIEFFEADLSRL